MATRRGPPYGGPRREVPGPPRQVSLPLQPLEESGLRMTVEGLTGAIASSMDRAINAEIASFEGFGSRRVLRTFAGPGNAPMMVLLAAFGEAGSTYSTILSDQLVTQVAGKYSRQQLGLDSRVLQLVSAPSPGVSVPGMFSLFASHTPFLQVMMDAATDATDEGSPLPLTLLAEGITEHRASAVISGIRDQHASESGAEPPLALSVPDIERALTFDFRSVSLSVIQPSKLPHSSDLSFGAASLLTERVFTEESNGWVLSTGSGVLPQPEIEGWRGSEDTGRMLHFHWEPPALAAQTATEAELVFGLAGTRDLEADDLRVLGERFGRADSGRILAAEELAVAWPVPRGGTERWALMQTLLEEAGLLPEEEGALVLAQTGKSEVVDEQSAQAAAGGGRAPLSFEIVRQQMANVVNEALELLTNVSEIHADQSLMEVGLNSMHAAQLRDIIYSNVGTAHSTLPPLPATMVFDYPTKAAITDFLADQIAPIVRTGPGAPQESKGAAAPTAKALTDTRSPTVKALEQRAKYEEILDYTRAVIGEVLGLTNQGIGDDVPLMNAGVNSMHAAQLRDFLQQEARVHMGLSEVALPATLVFDYPTTSQIAGFLFAHVDQTAEEEEEAQELQKYGQEDELGEMGGQEGEPTWCVARAKRLLRNHRKIYANEIRFCYVLEAPVLEQAFAAMGDQSKTGMVMQAPAMDGPGQDLSMAVADGGEEAMQRLTKGYVKGEGRVFLAYQSSKKRDQSKEWFNQFNTELKQQDEFRTRVFRSADLLKHGRRRDVFSGRRYSVAGTWTKWQLEDMERTENEMYVRTVLLRAGTMEEFQILVDGDWSKVHYPPPGPCGAHAADTMGPGEAHGRNFFIQVPYKDDRKCTIAFSPELRRLHWYFWAPDAETGAASSSAPPAGLRADPVAATASWAAGVQGGWSSSEGRKRRRDRYTPTEGYFVTGNWDQWAEFVKLLPVPGAEEPLFRAEIPVVAGSMVEFQLVADRDVSKRYTPRRKVCIRVPVTGGKTAGILGPTDQPALHWIVTAPPKSKAVHLSFNPAGEKSLRWEFK